MKVISVENVSKRFMLNYARPRNLADGLRGFLRRNSREAFWALKDVSFAVEQGEALGIIGHNGAGKSTMLKLLTHLMYPTEGRIRTRGRVSALIEIGAGFHPEMTGRENIYLNGSILGMSRREIDKKFDAIVAFAELEEFIDIPVKRYSSGMYVRLGFAVAAHVEPEILIVDEVLSVGDAGFQRKCLNYLQELRRNGVTFVIVSHSMQLVEAVATQGIVLESGKIVFAGDAGDAVSRYDMLMLRRGKAEETTSYQPSDPNSLALIHKYPDFGTDEVRVESVAILNERGEPSRCFDSAEPVFVVATVNSDVSSQARLSLSFINERDISCLGTRQLFQLHRGRQVVRLGFDPIQLSTGTYRMWFNVYDETLLVPYTNGIYGTFEVVRSGSVRVPGVNTPVCWASPQIQVTPCGSD